MKNYPGSEENILEQGTYDLAQLEAEVSKSTQWMLAGSGSYRSVTASHTKLPAGVYDITLDRNTNEPIFIKKTIKTDELISIPEGLAEHTLEEIEKFWESKDRFKTNGVLHRRGYILYGAQGTGKSSILNLVMNGIIKRDGVVLVCTHPSFFRMALATFRQVEPTRNLVCIFEDIDAIIKKHGDDELLNILDGTNQVDSVLNIATTNYPELLDKRFISRPRRFDRAIKIMPPTEKERSAFFKAKLPKDADVKSYITATDGLSFASLTEVIIGVQCLDYQLADIVTILKDLETRNYKNEEDAATGFAQNKKTDTLETD